MSQTPRFIGIDMPRSTGQDSDRTIGSPQADPDGSGIAAPSVWSEREDVVQAIKQWSRDFGGGDASAAELLCDRHPAEDTAFLVVDKDLDVTNLSYGELADRSSRLATALSEMGIGQGDRVAVLMNKCVELPITLLAIWRLGAVHIPLFTAFATPAIQMRVEAGAAKLIITDADQRPKVTPLKGLAVIETGEQFDGLIAKHEPLRESARLGGDGVFVQLFTSGTTGKPKGVPVPIRAGAAFTSYMRFGLDVTEDDLFWNAADPGWAYGLYYGIIGPLAIGRPNILLSAGFSAPLTVEIIDKLGVTNFTAAPTVYRSMKQAGVRLASPLCRASSAGEPLTPDVSTWSSAALGVDVFDHYGQTEHGMVIVNGWHDSVRAPVLPGSMGQALPGFVAGTVGTEIALSTHESPLMWFTGYLDAPEKTRERFTSDGDWFLTADVGRQEDGYFYFSSRDDDVIIMAGYRIGPSDIEAVLTSHAAVIEAAVVGRPDEIRGEVLEAFVVLEAATPESAELACKLQSLVKEQYAAHAYPRKVHFVDALPKTASGKIQRYILRQA